MSHMYPALIRLGPDYDGLSSTLRVRALDIYGTAVVYPTNSNVTELGVAGDYGVLGGLALPDGFKGFIQWSVNSGVTWLREESVDLALWRDLGLEALGLPVPTPAPPVDLLYEWWDPDLTCYTDNGASVEATTGDRVAFIPGQKGLLPLIQTTDASRFTLTTRNGRRTLQSTDGLRLMTSDSISAKVTNKQPFAVLAEVYFPRVGSPLLTLNVADASNASPIVITTKGAHSLTTGKRVTITGVGGNTAANVSNSLVTVIDAYSFSLDGVAGSGAYTSGGTVAGAIGASNATPIVVETLTPHGFQTGNRVTTTGFLGNTAANVSVNAITVLSANSFSLDGTTGNGAYTGGGTITLPQQTIASVGLSSSSTTFINWGVNSATSMRAFSTRRNGAASATDTVVGNWADPELHYYAFVYDGTYVYHYIDGVCLGAQAALDLGNNSANRFTIGCQRNVSNSNFCQIATEFGRIYTWDLAPTEAQMAAATRQVRSGYNGTAIDLLQRITGQEGEDEFNSFTSLAYFGGRWLVAYRSGTTHTSGDGIIRIKASSDFVSWTLIKSISADGIDYRDPHLCEGPDGTLLLYSVEVDATQAITRVTKVWQSTTGLDWTEVGACAPRGYWLWSPRKGPDGNWHCLAYTIGAGVTETITKFLSADGLSYTSQAVVSSVAALTEADMTWAADGTAYAIIRQDGGIYRYFATATAPYASWSLTRLQGACEAPRLITLTDDRIIASGRPSGANRCDISFLNKSTGALSRQCVLPTLTEGGYAGMVQAFEDVYTSWYSAHQPQAPSTPRKCVYVGRVRLPDAV